MIFGVFGFIHEKEIDYIYSKKTEKPKKGESITFI